MKAKTSAELREIDRRCVQEYHIPALILMEHAGEAAAQHAMELNPSRRQTVVIVGKGNNGGDGFVVARLLHLGQVPVKVWTVGSTADLPKESAPWVNLQMIKHLSVPIEHYMAQSQLRDLGKDMRNAGLVVDAMLGTGLSGDVREPYGSIINEINASGSKVLAVDVPSGLDADTGEPNGVAVRAARTVTFVAPKPGFETEQGREYCGEVAVIDIGVPRELL